MGNSVRGRSCWPVGGWFKIHWVVWIVCELLGRKEHDGWSMVCQKQIGLEDCSIVTSQAVPSTFAAVRFALNDGSREVSIQSLRNGPETTSVGPVPTGRHREQWPVGNGPTLDTDREVNSRQFLSSCSCQASRNLAGVKKLGDVQCFVNSVNAVLAASQRDGRKTMNSHPVGIQASIARPNIRS